MKHTGWRKPTPGLGIAEQLAQAGERAAVPKSRAFVAVKRVGAYLGLKAGDMMLLDTLGAFTQAQDWEERQRPIVWASNAYLMEQTGFSLSALKRHARRLAEAGVISFGAVGTPRGASSRPMASICRRCRRVSMRSRSCTLSFRLSASSASV
ncbi:hypothetical protein GCM10011324_40870 [Allosediminivita pacifica]|nr:hypothetical protein GCM10011324_40870 [Allosediminivita pacifica]